MKRIICVILAVIMCLSFTACKKDNIVEYEFAKLVFSRMDTHEEISSVEAFDGTLKIDFDNSTIEFTDSQTHSGTMNFAMENDGKKYYTIDWDVPPVAVEGYEVYRTELVVVDGGLLIGFCSRYVSADINLGFDVLATQVWTEK